MDKNKVQEMIDKLELAVMKDEVELPSDHSPYVIPVESVIHAMAEIEDRSLTLHELFKQLPDSVIEIERVSDTDYHTMLTIQGLYRAWVDMPALIAREDNILGWEGVAEDWRIGYQKSMSDTIVKHGLPARLYASYYGWADYDLVFAHQEGKHTHPIVGVFDVQEDYWHEFNGTFCTDDDSHSGMVAEVVFSNGTARKYRYEGSLGETMRHMLDS